MKESIVIILVLHCWTCLVYTRFGVMEMNNQIRNIKGQIPVFIRKIFTFDSSFKIHAKTNRLT